MVSKSLTKKMKKFQRYKLSEYKNYYNSIICLPSGYDLRKKDLDKVIQVIAKID